MLDSPHETPPPVLLSLLALATSAVAATPAKPTPTPAPSAVVTVPATLLKELKPRSIGPAIMGGRVSDIALDPIDPFTFYVALGTGGLMKTSDNGGSFQGVFDDQAVASGGAVAVAPSDAKVVWLGTGRHDRNSSSWPTAYNRSAERRTRPGSTWGSRKADPSRASSSPEDPAVAWVRPRATCGRAGASAASTRRATRADVECRAHRHRPHSRRRWAPATSPSIPRTPDIVYAALYARQRTALVVHLGTRAHGRPGPGRAIFKSSDGGGTWSGSPGTAHRHRPLGPDVFRKDPRIVYAIVQSDEAGTSKIDDVRSRRGGVFRSEDAGETWVRTSPLNPRPFLLQPDPRRSRGRQEVYVLGFAMHVLEDGGKTFR